MSDMPTALITPQEAAMMLGVGTRTVARWADDGKLAVAKLTDGGQRRFDHDTVAALAATMKDDAA